MRSLQAEFVIAGSGPGGASAAKQLSASGRDVLILERGSASCRPILHRNPSSLWGAGGKLLRKAAGIRPYVRDISVRAAAGVGGTSVMASANAVRGWEKELRSWGVDLEPEFDELEKIHGISPFPDSLIGRGASALWKAADSLGIAIHPIPKLIDFSLCEGCGLCNRSCPNDAKWTAADYIDEAVASGARLISETAVTEVITKNGKAEGVRATGKNGEDIHIASDKVILAAGAVGTASILQRSGLDSAGQNIFCHPLHVVHGPLPNGRLAREPRSIHSYHFLEEAGFVLANTNIISSRNGASLKADLGLMVKTKDDTAGKILPTGAIRKKLSDECLSSIKKSIKIASEILAKAGVNRRDIQVRYHAATHPGGTAALGKVVDSNFETEMKNCFVADASVLPAPTGLPPILTVLAIAKKLAKRLAQNRAVMLNGYELK